ncbi:trans-sulfuration enzyme family protein [Brachyspira alvinipulli]|uniref:trans-sulfuration enzyme family protein n=1 Tax=Brachyspira alvinipulli TaxID=84379 RepID=UPI0004889C9A|nr:PLP-dependent aspartate aminotransferase family protein [Brachyspira alvinipulli]
MSKLNLSNVKFNTKVVHAAQNPDPLTGALSTPIYQTSTFCFETVEEGAQKFNKTIPGYMYTRGGNPTTRILEEKMAIIEGGEDCVATASGMGAVGATMVAFLKSGDHVICGDTLYGGTSVVMRTNLPQFGIDVTFVDTSDLDAVKKAFTEKTKLIYFETPTNPLMKVTDIKAVSDIAHERGVKVIVDSTFAPPPIQFPIKLGADIVIHSVTKYLNGHGDVLGGVVIGKKDDISLIRVNGATKICGTTPSPLSSYLILRGLKTLVIRLERHCYNAMKLAEYLKTVPFIKEIYYLGFESNPFHELAKKQMNGMYSGIFSFELKDNINGMSSFEAGKKLVNGLKIASIAVSLGDPDTLIQHPASMTHLSVPKEIREQSGITDGLIRISVGIEDVEDLIEDFKQSFYNF